MGKRFLSFIMITTSTRSAFFIITNGSRYCISPYGMTWEDGRYYLIGYSDVREKIMTFRADRMGDVDVLSEEIIPMPEWFGITDFVNRVFRMYDEDDVRVTLLCKNELMKSVIDRFGIDVEIMAVSDTHFETYVDVSASRTFYGWVFQFGGDIKITKPKRIKDEFRKMCSKFLK